MTPEEIKATFVKLAHDDPFWQRSVWSELSSGARMIFHPPPLAIWGKPDLLLDFCTPLGRIVRFSGQGRAPFSVAFHTLVAHEIGRIKGFSPKALLAVLMHDLAEAITSDIPQPVKVYTRMIASGESAFSTALTRIEDLVESEVRRMLEEDQVYGIRGIDGDARTLLRYQLWAPDEAVKRQVALADAAALRVEAIVSMPSAGHGWPIEVDLSPAEQKLAVDFVHGWGSTDASVSTTLHRELLNCTRVLLGGAR